MHLWTEYVGHTLAGYSLDRLSRSEGRSAFFMTGAEGRPALLRVTEAHFDDGELIGRWQKIAAVHHPALQELRRSGQTDFDGVGLAFCELEPTDTSLSEVLRERVLSADEAAEVAEAVAGALSSLHAAGLVHGQVDAINVFAVGEAVKLRSDCARECAGDFEADTQEAREELRKRDVHDLGLLLRRCLTPQWEESTAMQLPSPFDRIVRRALNGSVSAAGIVAEMEELKPAPAMTARAAAAAVAAPVVAAKPLPETVLPQPRVDAVAARRPGRIGAVAAPSESSMAAHSPAAVSARLADRAQPRGEAVIGTRPERVSLGVHPSGPREGAAPESAASDEQRRWRVRNRVRLNTGVISTGGVRQAVDLVTERLAKHKAWVVAGLGAAVIGFVAWDTTGGAPHELAGSRPVSRPAVQVQGGTPPISVATVTQPRETAARTTPAQTSLLTSGTEAGWRVIAYTYRYEKQAEVKAAQLKTRYVGLRPQVYSPTGRAPFFVALGGPSDSVGAIALRNRARREGLPRDTYARNF